MNLTSDLPFWTVRDGLQQIFPALERDLKCDALIIGGGISGALLAYRLVRAGVDCILIDARDIGHGSTSASTALLQYEIDTPLYKLREKVSKTSADRAYRMGLEAVRNLQALAGKDCGFAKRPSLQIAMNARDAAGLIKEYEARRELRLPVRLLDRRELGSRGFEGEAALRSSVAAEVDPYLLTHRLLRLACGKGLRVFDRTRASGYTQAGKKVTTSTDRGAKIKSRAVFFATGYETNDILPKGLVRFKSTYALISEPMEDLGWWHERSLIWGTGDPYFYMRTTDDKRVIVGGEDDGVLAARRRDRQIPMKTSKLVRRFQAVFPKRAMEPAFAWAGAFGSTKDGLGYIGPHACFPRAYFALGFGGNGITFSEIASRMLTDMFLGRRNGDEEVFAFGR